MRVRIPSYELYTVKHKDYFHHSMAISVADPVQVTT